MVWTSGVLIRLCWSSFLFFLGPNYLQIRMCNCLLSFCSKPTPECKFRNADFKIPSAIPVLTSSNLTLFRWNQREWLSAVQSLPTGR